MRAYFGSKISNNMTRTPAGFLICMNVPIARTGWYEYLAREIGGNGDEVVQVYRDDDEVFSKSTMASFEGAPVVNDHPPEGVSPDNSSTYTKGATQNVRRGKGDDDDLMVADLIIYDQELIRAIENGKREVSAGYECDYEDHGDGNFAQRNIVGNHVAVVDAGRAGDRVRIQDHSAKSERRGVKHTRVPDVYVNDGDIWIDGKVCTADAKCDQYKNKDGTFKNGFKGAVEYFKCQGHSEEAAKKIAGKIAAEKGEDEAPDTTKVRDSRMSTIKLPRKVQGGVSRLFAAVGFKQYAMDAEPDEIMDAFDALHEERYTRDEDTTKESEKEREDTKDAEEEESNPMMEMLKGIVERLDKLEKGGKTDDEDPEKKLDDAIAQMEEPEGTVDDDEESETVEANDEEGPVMEESDRPQSGFKAADSRSALAYLKSMKPYIAKMKDPAEKKMMVDAALKAVKGRAQKPSSTYQKMAKPKKTSDTQVVDEAELGRNWAKKYNPHYKEQA